MYIESVSIFISEVRKLNEIKVEMRIDGKPYYLHDKDENEMTFSDLIQAVHYLNKAGFTDKEIMRFRFIYTNESRECKCHLCEKRGDCYMKDKFQRLPRELTRGMGLGLCPKLEAVKGGNT